MAEDSMNSSKELPAMEAYSKATMSSVARLTQLSNCVPCDENYALYSSYKQFKLITDIHGKKCQQLMSKLLRKYNIRGNLVSSDVQEKLDIITEANDYILEIINGELDVASGVNRPGSQPVMCNVSASVTAPTAINARWNLNTNRTQQSPVSKQPQQQQQQRAVSLWTAHNVERPQLSFSRRVNNAADSPFVPIISDKPHALRPLAILLETHEDGSQHYSHPYEFELERFEPGERFLCAPAQELVGQPPVDCDNIPVTWVATSDGLDQLLIDLGQVDALAVDVEHHSYRSYQGITCLIQISSRQRDYIIDALALRDHLQSLNQLFTNPDIVKVLHGADMDVQWLQRDCGVYLVHMFDTYRASRLLQMPRFSLAYLLQHFCSVQPDKRLQLADWRLRPLSPEMLKYAQQDTHYLLYIYDRLRQLLLERGNEMNNLLRSVYSSSTQVCLTRYEKPVVLPDSHMDLYHRSRKIFNARQMTALASLYQWRDNTARQEDESVHYVLPTHMLLHIADVLPREMQGIIACCNPVPPLVRQNVHQMHKMILQARAVPLQPPASSDTKQSSMSASATGITDSSAPVLAGRCRHYDADSALNCPHDDAHVVASDLASTGGLALLQVSLSSEGDSVVVKRLDPVRACLSARTSSCVPVKTSPSLQFAPKTCLASSHDEASNDPLHWISPYQRYNLLIDGKIDDKGKRLMDDLSESTEQAECASKKRHHSPAASLPQLHRVLPEVKVESDDDDDEEEDGDVEEADGAAVQKVSDADITASDNVPRRLRVSRADKIREMKAAGTYSKQRKKKGRLSTTCTVPLSVSQTTASASPSSPANEQQMAAPSHGHFDYSTVNYDELMKCGARDKRAAQSSASKQSGGVARGRSRGSHRRRGGKFQVFGGLASTGRPR